MLPLDTYIRVRNQIKNIVNDYNRLVLEDINSGRYNHGDSPNVELRHHWELILFFHDDRGIASFGDAYVSAAKGN